MRGRPEIASGAGGGVFEGLAEGASTCSTRRRSTEVGAAMRGEDSQATRALIGRATDVSGVAVA